MRGTYAGSARAMRRLDLARDRATGGVLLATISPTDDTMPRPRTVEPARDPDRRRPERTRRVSSADASPRWSAVVLKLCALAGVQLVSVGVFALDLLGSWLYGDVTALGAGIACMCVAAFVATWRADL